jgi:hypothetical protein
MKIFYFFSRKADTHYLWRHVNVTNVLVANIRLNRKAVFFVWTWHVSTKSVYHDVTFQHLLNNIQLFGMLLYQYYSTVYNEHYKHLT